MRSSQARGTRSGKTPQAARAVRQQLLGPGGARDEIIGLRTAQRCLPARELKLAGVGGCRYHTRPFRAGLRSSAAEHREKHMASYTTSEIRGGMKVLLDGDPYAVIENEFVKPGKGQAFNRIKVRNLKTGRTIEKTFRSGESLEAADVVDTEMQYLYQDGDFWHFMHAGELRAVHGRQGRRRRCRAVAQGRHRVHHHAVEQRAAAGDRRRRTSS